MTATGSVLVVNDSGQTERFTPTADTAAARGTALVNAFAYAGEYDLILTGPGTYLMDSSVAQRTLTMKTGQSLIGSGMGITFLNFTGTGTATTNHLKVVDDCFLKDFTLKVLHTDGSDYGIGYPIIANVPAATTYEFTAVNVEAIGRNDAWVSVAAHASTSGLKAHLYHCVGRSGWDCYLLGGTTAASETNLYGCLGIATYAFGGSTSTEQLCIGDSNTNASAVTRVIGGRYIATSTGGGQASKAIRTSSSANCVVELDGGVVLEATGGSSSNYIVSDNGYGTGIVNVGSARYDPTQIEATAVVRPRIKPHDRQQINLAAGSQTLRPDQSGQRFVGAVDAVFTLPAASANTKGVWYDFETGVASSGTGLSISPAAADAVAGNGLTATVNKDLINTGATDRIHDSVRLYCTGTTGATAWVITSIIGTWAKEP